MASIEEAGQRPRVRLTYDAATADGVKHVELPLVIGVLADLSGKPAEPLPRLRERKFIAIDRDNFRDVMRAAKPRVAFRVADKLTGEEDRQLALDLGFGRGWGGIEEFDPVNVAMQIEPLRKLVEVRKQLASLHARMDGNDTLKERLEGILNDPDLAAVIAEDGRRWFPEEDPEAEPARRAKTERPHDTTLDRIIDDSRIGWNDWERDAAGREIVTLVGEFLSGTVVVSKDIDYTVRYRIADIDALVSIQLNEVLHHHEFIALEASWRGLYYLVNRATAPGVKLCVMNVSKKDLGTDLERAAEFDQSGLFRKVYEEYSFFGGEPFGVLVGDYFFDGSDPEITLLERIANVAEAANAPFIAGASPGMFNCESMIETGRIRSFEVLFRHEHVRWRQWRDSSAARYVALALPRLLLRRPYRPEDMPAGTFAFTEDVDETTHARYVWGNAAYAFAAQVADAFQRDGWCAAIRGYETGGLVPGIATHALPSDSGDMVVEGPTEIVISDRRCRDLAEQGFIALCQEKRTDRAVFFSTPSCAKPRQYATPRENAASLVGARFEYVMTMSRFAHYFRAMARDRVEDFGSAADCERFFADWIARYVRIDPPATDEEAVRWPLRHARINVSESRDWRGGFYRLAAILQPGFRLPESTQLELIVDLVKPAQS